MRWILAAALLVLAACQASPEAAEPEDPTVLVPPMDREVGGVAVAPPPAPESPALEMKSVTFAEGGMRLSIVDQPHDVHPWEQGGVLSQTVHLDEDNALRILVRVGKGESLEGFRRDHERAELSEEQAVMACERPARRLGGSQPEEHITCIVYADGRPNSPGYIPAETTVVVAFEHRGLGVTASWEIPTAMRGRYRDLEGRFFASLRCQ